jgi:hypothetical protein
MLEDNFSSNLAKNCKVAGGLHRNIYRIPALCLQLKLGGKCVSLVVKCAKHFLVKKRSPNSWPGRFIGG